MWESSHGTSSHLRLSPWRHYVSLFSRCCWSLPSRPATSCGHGTDQATRHSTSASSSQTASGCSSLNRRLPTLASPRISLALPVYVHMHLNESLASPFSFPPAHPLPLPCSYGRQSCIGLRIMPSTSSKTTGKEAEWKLTRLKEGWRPYLFILTLPLPSPPPQLRRQLERNGCDRDGELALRPNSP